MKYKNLTLVIIIVILIILAIFLINILNNYNTLKSEDKQVSVLYEIYLDLKNSNSTHDNNIILDESSFKNIITKEKFSQNNIDKLKSLEETNTNNKYILSTNYVKKNKMLTLKIQDENGKLISTHEYKLYVENNEIKFEAGISTIGSH